MALPYARAIAERYGSTFHVVHVVRPEPVVIRGEFGGEAIEVETENEASARAQMDQLVAAGAFTGLAYTLTVQIGAVWNTVSRLTGDLKVDLIVMGTHGRRGMKHILLGSIAEQVFRRATCPVLTVGPDIRNSGMASGDIHTILYATDFSTASLNALGYATYLARTNQARITLLHGAERNRKVGEAEQRLAALVAGEGIDFGVVAESRPAAEMILDLSRQISADIIVMWAHRGVPAIDHMPWTVAHEVVCCAPCPVLTVRS
jgi:nucleotide-binding universal stress UspA family protein